MLYSVNERYTISAPLFNYSNLTHLPSTLQKAVLKKLRTRFFVGIQLEIQYSIPSDC